MDNVDLAVGGDGSGWVPLKVICNFPKVKKLSKDIRAIAAALEGSDVLVVSKATRVRRKVRVVWTWWRACAALLIAARFVERSIPGVQPEPQREATSNSPASSELCRVYLFAAKHVHPQFACMNGGSGNGSSFL